MKFRTLLTAAVALIFSASANADLIIDLEGYEALSPTPDTLTFANADTGAVTDVSFDFAYEAAPNGGAAWGSDMILELSHVPTGVTANIGTQDGSCDAFGINCDFDLMWVGSTGMFTGAGTFSFMDAIADGSGDWSVTATSRYDDPLVEGIFLAGSSITIGQEVAAVPAPSLTEAASMVRVS